MSPTTPVIAIVGGGFAGLKTALELDRRLRPGQAEVVLVDRSPFHTLRPKLPQAIGGRIPCAVHIPFESILAGTNVRLIQEGVERIEDGPIIVLENGELRPDYLVLTLGAESRAPDPAFLPAWSFDQACGIRRRLGFLAKAAEMGRPANLNVAIIGAGFVGVELAAEIQHRLRRLGLTERGAGTTLIEREDRILPLLPAKAARLAERRLNKLGVRIITAQAAKSVEKDEVILENGEKIASGTTIWAGGAGPSSLVAGSPYADGTGRIPVDRYLQAIDHPNVYAAGDCAYIFDEGKNAGEPSAHRAESQAKIVAHNIVAALNGRFPAPHKPEPNRYLLGLGPGYGILVSPPFPIISGRLPGLIKEGVLLRHVRRIGGAKLAKEARQAMIQTAVSPKHWDGEPLPEGNIMCACHQESSA